MPRQSIMVAAVLTVLACASAREAGAPPSATATERWCSQVPRATNQAFGRVPVATNWFDVYQVDPGVYALVEANQFQETISYLILGKTGALLFDTGLGLVPIRPVVEQLTSLPVRVLNSHTHYDHVGGNADFDQVLALDTPYTRANQRGFSHAELASEVAPESFCQATPPSVDTSTFRTRPWRASRRVADGDTLDLGDRVLEILQVPGHTPDAVALLDREHRLLWTGDTYYDAPVWLYVPETDMDGYQRSVARLAGLAAGVKRLLPAHNTVSAEPARLAEMEAAISAVRSGSKAGAVEAGNRIIFRFPAFSILTAQPVLDGKVGDQTRGGSGLTTWP